MLQYNCLNGKRVLTAKEENQERIALFSRAFPPTVRREDFFMEENRVEENRIAVLSIMVQQRDRTEKLNAYLSEFGEYVVGRMGIPYRERWVSVLCVVLDAPAAAVNALTGKIGQLSGVSAKTVFAKS